MPAERVTINPAIENTALQSLDLVGIDPSWGIYLLTHEYPTPEQLTQHAGGADTDGDPVVSNRWGNRFIAQRIRLVEPEDPAAANYMRNPSAEIDVTQFSVGAVSWASSFVQRWPSWNVFAARNAGDYAARLTATKDATVTGRTLSLSQATESGMVVAGQKYSAQVRVHVADNLSGGFGLRIDWYTSGSVYISSSATSALFTGTGEKQLSLANQEAPATAAIATVVLVGTSTVSGDVADVYTDAWQFEQGSVATAYFDGDTPGCHWGNTRHNSNSFRPAPDGTRFSRIYRDAMRQIDRISRQRSGTLRRIAPGFQPVTYDLMGAKITEAPQDISLGMKRAEIAYSFEAEPGGRTAEVQVATGSELTKPALTLLAAEVPGDMPGLGRLLVKDTEGQAQQAFWWGLQQRYYDAASSAELFYEAETRTPLGSTATAVLSGASGAGSNTLLQNNLVPAYQGIFSTQASGGGAHLSNVGTYRVLVRVYRPTGFGEVSLKWAWKTGDFINVTENDEDVYTFLKTDGVGVFTICDLGLVTLPKAPAGTTQRWEGRLLAKSTIIGDDLNVDWLMLVPVDEGSGKALTSSNVPAPTSLSGYDQMITGSGAMSGRVAGIGGTWSGAGDADDFTQTTGGAQRTAVSDVAGTPRYEILGATKYTDVVMRLRAYTNNKNYDTALAMGGFVRYSNVSNWVAILVHRELGEVFEGGGETGGSNANVYYAQIWKKVAGVKTSLGVFSIPGSTYPLVPGVAIGVNLEIIVLSNGEWRAGANGTIMRTGVDADLASAGALKEGTLGLLDERTAAAAETRLYANLEAWAPSIDQVAFPNKGIEVRSDQVRREDSSGTTWGQPPYEGNYLLIPPSGPEKTPTRVIAKLSRNQKNDAGIDNLQGTLFVQPRYLEMPPS